MTIKLDAQQVINPPDIRIRDFGSKNGTFVNGKKNGHREAHHTPEYAAQIQFPEYDLQGGDEFTIGDTYTTSPKSCNSS